MKFRTAVANRRRRHLGTDYVDSYVLHGPASAYGWSDADAEVWAAMVKERDAGLHTSPRR